MAKRPESEKRELVTYSATLLTWILLVLTLTAMLLNWAMLSPRLTLLFAYPVVTAIIDGLSRYLYHHGVRV